MRLKHFRTGVMVFLLCCGTATLFTSIFAVQFGIDNDPGWGKGRFFLLAVSILSFLSALAIWFREAIHRRAKTIVQVLVKVQNRILQTTAYSFLAGIFRPLARLRSKVQRAIPEKTRTIITLSLACFVVIFTYLYFITVGTLTEWMPYSHYYDRLADAFLAGQVSLLEQPPIELAQLEDPYNYLNREGIHYLWDASYYQEHYYLYWGLVPAMLAAMIKIIHPVVVEDQTLLFGFCSGFIIVFALILNHIRSLFFPKSPIPLLFAAVLMAGLSTPVFWLINRPNVYETAIASGQFFLMLGMYAALKAIAAGQHKKRWLVLTGFAWGAAFNSRLSLIFAIVWLLLVLTVIIWKQSTRKLVVSRLGTLLIPFLVWGLLFGAYNMARFGSPLETGHRYQLTGLAMPEDYADVTSAAYLLPSLYGYLIRPLTITPLDFPFFRASFIAESMWPGFIKLPPAYYYAEPLAGIFYLMPALLFLFVPGKKLVGAFGDWLHEKPVNFFSSAEPRHILWWVLAVAGILLLAPLLIFISTSMRYLADFAPMFIVLAFIHLWNFQIDHQKKPVLLRRVAFIFMVLVLLGIVMSILVNFTNGDKRFESLNPAVYYGVLLKIFKQ